MRLRERVLDLIGLLLVLALSAVVFVLAGPQAFTVVTGSAVGLFTAWRTGRRS